MRWGGREGGRDQRRRKRKRSYCSLTVGSALYQWHPQLWLVLLTDLEILIEEMLLESTA